MGSDRAAIGWLNGDGQPLRDLHYEGVPAAAEQLPPLRRALTRWSAAAGLGPEAVEAVGLAAYEAMANVVEHAYGEGGGVFELQAVSMLRESRVLVTVTDFGRWLPLRDGADGRGRGLRLIRRLAHTSEVLASHGGTTVHMTWSFRPGD